MNTVKNTMKRLFLPLCLLLVQPAWAQNAIEALGVSQQGSDILVKLTTSQPLASDPASFSVANPPRIAFDFPGTGNALGKNTREVGDGDLRNMNIVQAGGRTRCCWT